MADDDGDDMAPGVNYSRLLFGGDDVVSFDNPPLDQSFGHTSYSPSFCYDKPPKMLCFGDYNNSGGQELVFDDTTTTHQTSGVACTNDSSTACSGNANIKKSNRKRVGSVTGHELTQNTNTVSATQKTGKRAKQENSPARTGHVKVRREKLGERITALQQLVSPYGKTDTASVLHEAMGYIRFLHDQVQVLCSPYLQGMPSTSGNGENEGQASSISISDLKSRGLCLVPVACTMHVENNNGADFWSPAMAIVSNSSNNNNVSFAPPTHP